MAVSYRDAGIAYWGEAGAYAYDAYDRLRAARYPGLPAQVPIVIGITAYGHCDGLTRPGWKHGPRISLFSSAFRRGHRYVDDLLEHEMLHVWLAAAGQAARHDSAVWYDAVRRLSPAVCGCQVDVRRGAGRRSVRVPNPAYRPGGDAPRTLVRKQADPDAVQHADVARWPSSFRPEGYDWGKPIDCPPY